MRAYITVSVAVSVIILILVGLISFGVFGFAGAGTKDVVEKKEYYLKVIEPNPNIDYKIGKIEPDPSKKYSLRVLNAGEEKGK